MFQAKQDDKVDILKVMADMMADREPGEWPEGRGLRILIGSEQRVRAIIAEDGEVSDATGVTLAYIESNGEVGDASMNFAGKAHMQAHQVVDQASGLALVNATTSPRIVSVGVLGDRTCKDLSLRRGDVKPRGWHQHRLEW